MPATLLQDLGGSGAVSAVAKELLDRVAKDDRTKKFFEGKDNDWHAGQHRKVTAFLIHAFGGPNNYDGKSMYEAHRELHLKNEHFDAVGEMMVQTMKDFKVHPDNIDRCMVIAETLREQIVEQIDIESIKKQLLTNRNPNLGRALFRQDEAFYASIAADALKVGMVSKWGRLVMSIVMKANGCVSDNIRKEFVAWVMGWGISEKAANEMCKKDLSRFTDFGWIQNHPLQKKIGSNVVPNILCHGFVYMTKDGTNEKHFEVIYRIGEQLGLAPKVVDDQVFCTLKMENDLLNQFDKSFWAHSQ